jgi:type IX secretion system substrate protein
VVPVQVSLVSAEALDGMARIEWRLVVSNGVLFDIERRTHDSEWTAVKSAHVDGEGKIVHEDRGLIAGTEYGWRLQPRGSNEPIGEVWLAIPASATLALEGPVPNPATEGINVSFSLPAPGRASLELFDVGGRVIVSREVGPLGPGRHFVDFKGNGLRSGVYLLRLSTGSGSIVKRVAIAH